MRLANELKATCLSFKFTQVNNMQVAQRRQEYFTSYLVSDVVTLLVIIAS